MAEALATIRHPDFRQELAGCLCLVNIDAMAGVDLLAEWAVRCIYSQHVSQKTQSLPHDDEHYEEAARWVERVLEWTIDMARQFIACIDFHLHGPRPHGPPPSFWPNVHVLYARDVFENAAMAYAVRQHAIDVDTNDTTDDQNAVAQLGEHLLQDAGFTLPHSRSTL